MTNTKEKTMMVKTIRHQDVRGKELLYIQIGEKIDDCTLINVGEKTFKSAEDLLDGTKNEPKLIIDEKATKEAKGEKK